jgi:hypothetical protein
MKEMRAALELLSGDAETNDSSTKVTSWSVGKVLPSELVPFLLFLPASKWNGFVPTCTPRSYVYMAHCQLGSFCALIHLLTVWQVVSGKYVMIVDVIIDEQESLNTVLMVCLPLLLVCMMLSCLRERETLVN